MLFTGTIRQIGIYGGSNVITLKKIEPSDKSKFWNIVQKYLYEMTNYYDMGVMDELGNYQYRYFDSYFEDSERSALFIYDDGALVGFAMINDYSCLGNHIDHAIAEFTIFPHYRKRHLGVKSVQKIFEQHHGRWEIKYSSKNKAAEALWMRVTKKYNPLISTYGRDESVLSFVVT